MEQVWVEIARRTVRSVPSDLVERLSLYRHWLREEAIPAGGIGPGEDERIGLRHIADSLLFAHGFDIDPEQILDVGTGSGLPGIPLAVLFPTTQLTLLDRSGRRVDLTRRAVKVLGLENVEVVEGDIANYHQRFPVVVSRASLPPERFSDHLRRLLHPGGTGVLGGSWTERPVHPGYETREIGRDILDRPVWILIMRNT